MNKGTFNEYIANFANFKVRLFSLYLNVDCKLNKKIVSQAGGSTWGYRLLAQSSNGSCMPLTGSSIGEDEIKLLYDICHIIQPTYSYIIGNAFGFSTFCLALAWPAGNVIAIDNWSEGAQGIAARDITKRIIDSAEFKNVILHTGTSPHDTDAALESLRKPSGNSHLSLLFIDGLHTDEAAQADFSGALAYLNDASIVLWHDVAAVKKAFMTMFAESAKDIFDRHFVLRTYSPMGIFFNSKRYPLLETYLTDACLIWHEWEKYLLALSEAGALPGLLRLRRSLFGRIAVRLQKFIPVVFG